MTAKSINRIGIPHGYFLDLLDISIPHEYAMYTTAAATTKPRKTKLRTAEPITTKSTATATTTATSSRSSRSTTTTFTLKLVKI